MIDVLDKLVMKYWIKDQTPIIEYTGEGKLILKDRTELDCQFRAKQFTDGETLLICYLLPISIHRIKIEKWKTEVVLADCMQGLTRDGRFFEVIEAGNCKPLINEEPLVVCAAFNPKEFRIGKMGDEAIDSISFGITNFLFKGIPYNNSNYPEFIDFLDFSGKNMSLLKVKDYEHISSFMKIRNKQYITCELHADIANWDEIKTMEKKVDKLCYVLSVGSGSKVQSIFCNVFTNGSLVYARHIQVPNKAFNSQIIIDAEKDPQNWANYINVAYPSFLRYVDSFGEINGLPRIMAAIDVFTDARTPMDFIQTKGIKLAVTMEIVKEMFREAWMPEKKMLKNNEWKKMEKELKECLKPILGQYLSNEESEALIKRIYSLNRPSFKAILEKGFEMIKFIPDPKELELFKRNRNSLVHQGRFYSETATDDQKKDCKPLIDPKEDYVFVSNFLSQVFLALLGYGGPYNKIFIMRHDRKMS